MEIRNPRRMLILGPKDSEIPNFIKALTSTALNPPVNASGNVAGLSHEWRIKTAYYSTTVPIWIDEISSAKEWGEAFVSDEAKEVRDVVAAYVVVFRKPIDEDDLGHIKACLKTVQEVVKTAGDDVWDGVCLAVAMPQTSTPYLQIEDDSWDDTCMDYGFEFIDFEGRGKNEFGESKGITRVREALETNDWACDEDVKTDDLDGEEEESEEDEFGQVVPELEREMFGLRQSIYANEERDGREDGDAMQESEERQVEGLEVLMRKMVAVKELSEGMPEAERKRFAKKAVDSIMQQM